MMAEVSGLHPSPPGDLKEESVGLFVLLFFFVKVFSACYSRILCLIKIILCLQC